MKLFRQIVDKQAAPKRSEKRIKKLETQPQSTLEALVDGSYGDPDDIDVRVAALKHLPYTMATRNAALGGPPPLEKAARLHLAELVDGDQLSISQLMQDIGEVEKLLVIASYCKSSDFQNAVLEKIEDQAVLAEVCSSSPLAAVRIALAERIEEPELLRELLKTFKHKDKNVYKIAKAKLDKIKAEEDARAELKNKISRLCSDIEQHSQRVFDKDYTSRLERYARRWDELAEQAQESDQKRFATALDACRERVQEIESEQQELIEHEVMLSEADTNRKALLNEFWEYILGIYRWEVTDETKQETAKAILTEQRKKWDALKALGKVSERHSKQYSLLCDALESVLQQFIEKGTLLACRERISQSEAEPSPDDIQHLRQLLAPLSPLREFKADDTITSAQAIIKDFNAKEKKLRESKQKQVRVIGGLIRKSHNAVEQGRLKQALGIRHSVDEKLTAVDGLPVKLTAQLESLDEAIQKLIDWQAYAVVPKKEALVEAMEALVGIDLPPEALATKVKKLQDEWKELAQSGKDRQEDLWQRFSDAADKAYEPCKEYYQELSVVRQSNLEKRQALVKQLQDYFQENDWENADWRKVEKVLHTARKELHSYAPVERGANKAVQAAFDDAMSAIQAKLEAEYDKNKRSKEQVVAQAEKLAEMSDLEQAMETAKRLQAQWKTIGHCSYKEGERLWKEFRRHCDSVFAKKESVMAEQNAVLSENLAKANELIDSLKSVMKLNGEEFLATRAEKDRIKQAFREVGELPIKADKATQRNFAQTLESYESKVKQQLRRADHDAWHRLFSLNAEINAYQMAVNDNNPEAASMKDAISSSIAATARWPEGSQPKIKEKLESQPEGSPEANRKALRLLCIRSEILADITSPSEDKALRMEYQVNLLKKGLGQATTSSPASLALEWLEVGPVAPEIYQTLYQRFNETRQKLI